MAEREPTPQEKIARAIIVELRRQRDGDSSVVSGAWIDDDSGTSHVCLDGWFDLDKVGEALLDAGLITATPIPDDHK